MASLRVLEGSHLGPDEERLQSSILEEIEERKRGQDQWQTFEGHHEEQEPCETQHLQDWLAAPPRGNQVQMEPDPARGRVGV